MKGKKKAGDPEPAAEQPAPIQLLQDKPVLTPTEFSQLEEFWRTQGVKDEDLPTKMRDKLKTTDLPVQDLKRLQELNNIPVLTPEEYKELEDLFKKNGVKESDLPLKMKGKKRTTDEPKPAEGDLGINPKQRQRLNDLEALPVLNPNEFKELEDLYRKNGVSEEDLPIKMKPKKRVFTAPVAEELERFKELEAKPALQPEEYEELKGFWRAQGVKEEDLPTKIKNRPKANEEPKTGDLGVNPKQRKRLDELNALPVLTPDEFKELEELFKKDGVSENELPIKMKGKKRTTDEPLTLVVVEAEEAGIDLDFTTFLKIFEKYEIEAETSHSLKEYTVFNMPFELSRVLHSELIGSHDTVYIYPLMRKVEPKELQATLIESMRYDKPKPEEAKPISVEEPVLIINKPEEQTFVPEKIPDAPTKPRPKETNLNVKAKPKKRVAQEEPEESTPAPTTPATGTDPATTLAPTTAEEDLVVKAKKRKDRLDELLSKHLKS